MAVGLPSDKVVLAKLPVYLNNNESGLRTMAG